MTIAYVSPYPYVRNSEGIAHVELERIGLGPVPRKVWKVAIGCQGGVPAAGHYLRHKGELAYLAHDAEGPGPPIPGQCGAELQTGGSGLIAQGKLP